MSYNPEENLNEVLDENDENNTEENSVETTEENSEENTQEERPRVIAKAYVESSTRAEDMKSSGVAFLVVGILLIAVAVLIYMGIIPMGNTNFQKILNTVIVLVFSVAFIAVSVYSTRRAKMLDDKSVSEERLTEEIIQYCVEHYQEPEITDEEQSENIEEEIYFAREKVLRNLITGEYKGLTESYIDYLLEIIYTEIFENNKNEE